MPGMPWGNDDPSDSPVLSANVAALRRELERQTRQGRALPRIDLAHEWHRKIYAGVAGVPGPHYLGAFRGSSHPDLIDYEVVLQDSSGRVVAETPPPAEVADHLARLEASLRAAVTGLDAHISPGSRPGTAGELEAVVLLMAQMHGEWVKIHPYANGNGRTARTWANWVAVRYGLPPLVRIKPRPDGRSYPGAALASMGVPPDWIGNHQATFLYFLSLISGP